jgi:hypothetical protein
VLSSPPYPPMHPPHELRRHIVLGSATESPTESEKLKRRTFEALLDCHTLEAVSAVFDEARLLAGRTGCSADEGCLCRRYSSLVGSRKSCRVWDFLLTRVVVQGRYEVRSAGVDLVATGEEVSCDRRRETRRRRSCKSRLPPFCSQALKGLNSGP